MKFQIGFAVLAASAVWAATPSLAAEYVAHPDRDLRRATAWAAGLNGDAQLRLVSQLTRKPIERFTARPSPVTYVWVVRDKTDGAAIAVNQASNIVMIPGLGSLNVYGGMSKEAVDVVESEQLQASVLQNISGDISFTYKMGDGKGRNLALWTAVDCPGCAKLEKGMKSYTKGFNGIVRIFPTTLHPDSRANLERIWCSKSPEKAWTDWMTSQKAPEPGGRNETPGCRSGYELAEDLGVVLSGVGLRIHGTPSVIYENGLTSPYFLRTAGTRGVNLYTTIGRISILREGFAVPSTGWKGGKSGASMFKGVR